MISAAPTDPVDWQGEAERLVTDAPTWVLAVAGGAVLVALLIVGAVAMSRASKAQDRRDKEHQAAVALAAQRGEPAPPKPLHMDTKPLLGGFAVSLNGLWHFAQDQVHLSFFFAVGFVSMFDVLEIRLFAQMFRMANADPLRRWTRSLKALRFTAWALVTASAVANIFHAPNPWAAPFLGGMPIAAAWVIYVPLHSALGEADLSEDQRPEGRKPGPLLLLGLVWRKVWAWLFGLFGLDVNDRADEMVRRARAREAADASYALRLALQEKASLEKAIKEGGSRTEIAQAKKRLAALDRDLGKKVRPKAQNALENADTYDPEQGLQLMQRMAWLTNADEVALLDYGGPESPAMDKLRQLNIAANADFIKASKDAADANRKAAEAETLRQQAEKAVEEAEAKLADLEKKLDEKRGEVEDARKKAEANLAEEEQKLKALVEKRQALESSDASVAQLYRKTAEELTDVRKQLQELQDERVRLIDSRGDAAKAVTRLETEQKVLREQLEGLRKERQGLSERVQELEETAATAHKRVEELEEERISLRDQLQQAQTRPERKRTAAAPAGVPAQTTQPRVDARIGEDVSGRTDTRTRIRQLLDELPVEQRALSQREIAELLAEQVGIGEEGVRKHLRAIAKEDED